MRLLASRFLSALACAVLVMAVGTLPGRADKRVALVIGNDRYANLAADQQLQKAVNDSRAVGDALGQLGFNVIRGENLGRQAMVDKLDELTRQLSPGDTAFFFFAGHGVAIGGANFIIPSDVPNIEVGQDTRLARASLGETDIVTDLQGRGVRVAVVVLDACRDNPFRQPGVRGVGAERGLGRIEPPRGIFTLYSAGLGQTALDRLGDADRNPNSVFTRVLVPELTKPGVDLTALAIDVREEVARLAGTVGHDQDPAYYDQTIGGRVYLAGLPAEQSAPATAPAPSQGRAADSAAQAWNAVKDTTSVAVLGDFIRQYGDVPIYGTLAHDRLQTLKRTQVAVAAPPVVPALPTTDPCAGIITASFASTCSKPLTPAQERSLKPKDSFKECDKCPQMVMVPAGSFTMGSPYNEAARNDDEGPEHAVTIARPFAVGRFAITFDEWDACVIDGGCNGYGPDGEGWGLGRRPVINVSWKDAKTYVAWLATKTGKAYRLLSESENEYAIRAGTQTAYPWGSTGIDKAHANCAGCGSQWDNKQTAPVGSFGANGFDLYDMVGNVSEWTEDCWQDSYNGAPADGSAWTGGECKGRVARGGSWLSSPVSLRSAQRLRYFSDYRVDFLGFRVARTLTP